MFWECFVDPELFASDARLRALCWREGRGSCLAVARELFGVARVQLSSNLCAARACSSQADSVLPGLQLISISSAARLVSSSRIFINNAACHNMSCERWSVHPLEQFCILG